MRNRLRNLLSRFVSFMFRPLWCPHEWRVESTEDIGERTIVRITIRCAHCGRRECYPDC